MMGARALGSLSGRGGPGARGLQDLGALAWTP